MKTPALGLLSLALAACSFRAGSYEAIGIKNAEYIIVGLHVKSEPIKTGVVAMYNRENVGIYAAGYFNNSIVVF